MLRLQSSVLAHLLSSPSTSLNRLLSAVALHIPPNPSFAVEDYLIGTCGLTRAQALKASTRLSHLKSPSNPDAVLAFLADLGLSSAAVAAAIAKDPKLLCASVERTLSPIVVGLTGLGLSRSEIAYLASVVPASFRCSSIVSNLPYNLLLFSSYDNLLQALKCHTNLLGCSLEKVVKPNVAVLRDCGLSACDITKLCINATWVLTINPERLPLLVACAEGLGVPRGTTMFRHALHAVMFLNEEEIAAQVDNLKKTFSWSDAEVCITISKLPLLLTRSSDIMRRMSEFLISEVGLEPAYIAHRPAILCYSLEGRLKPRYHVVKFLKEKRLLDHDRSYYYAVQLTEKVFVEKFICPHSEAAPHLTQDYATVCRGEVPARFIFA